MIARPKDIPHRSDKWLAAVRSIESCVMCGAHGVQAAHQNEGKGKGMKQHDCLSAALCQACHSEIDQGRDMDRDERRDRMSKAINLTLVELVKLGKVVIV